ncbi:MAG: hypothetical protein J07HR59_00375 [Halorubrum sp. J07HR59]|nr:MAG: hypothetical protein J07HR59_00375 [Halorubrum sp. J07HR59]
MVNLNSIRRPNRVIARDVTKSGFHRAEIRSSRTTSHRSISSHLISSHLISSHLISSHLISSLLVPCDAGISAVYQIPFSSSRVCPTIIGEFRADRCGAVPIAVDSK